MKQPSENFCDVCKAHVKDETEGAVFFIYQDSVRTRIMDRSTANDVCLCNRCLNGIAEYRQALREEFE